MKCSSSPLFSGDILQDPQGMLEAVDSSETYILCIFLYMHMISFNL